jgi:hypothetical protein
MARGNVGLNLFVGGRATKTFDDQWPVGSAESAPNVFVPIPPPRGPSGKVGYSSVDCEPFVVINQSMNKRLSLTDQRRLQRAGKHYLELLYRRDNYMRLMNSVPIQLIPIFRSMAPEYGGSSFVHRWGKWYEQALKMVRDRRVNPYYVTRESDLRIPYLFDLYGAKVVTNMVTSVLAGERTPSEAAREAQRAALEVARR